MWHSKSIQPRTAIFRRSPILGLFFCFVLLLLALTISLITGTSNIHFGTVIRAFTAFDGSIDHQTVIFTRVPRTLTALLVGGGLAVAGALMQAITKNPLASPSIMGINAGASFAVVAAILFFGDSTINLFPGFSFLGATITGILVYGLGSTSRQGMTPIKLIIAGSTIGALFSSLTQGLLTLNERTLDEARYWLAGSIVNRPLEMVGQIAPYFIIGLLIALLLSKPITTLSMGDDIARGLGIHVGQIKFLAAISILLLASAAVSIAGPISFVGLAVPHLARVLVGVDYRWIIPYSIMLGGVLLLLSDVVARIIIPPAELPVGAITALIGAPVLISIVRQKVKRS